VNKSIRLNLLDKDIITHPNGEPMPYSETESTTKCSGRLFLLWFIDFLSKPYFFIDLYMAAIKLSF
jgi:hypothetical protein